MSHLDLDCLAGDSHGAHDNFVRTYLKTEFKEVEDCVVVPLLEKLLQCQLKSDKPKLAKFVNVKIDNRSSDSDTEAQRIHNLALYILLTQYPEQWDALFEAAYNLLVGLLDIICKMKVRKPNIFPTIYPPKWTQQIFRLEKHLAPTKLQGIIFGIDPISKESDPSKAATGYAFTFNRQRHMIPFAPSSTQGLLEAYCLKNAENYMSENGSQQLEDDDFMKKCGIGMVNFIRTIKQRDVSSKGTAGSANVFKEFWISYNKAWLYFMHSLWGGGQIDGATEPRIGEYRVLIFQNEYRTFFNYSDSIDFVDILLLLDNVPRCSHPSFIRATKDHCVLKPNTYYGKGRFGNKTDRCNTSVTDFREFLEKRGAHGALCCHCPNKSDPLHLTYFAQAVVPLTGSQTDDLKQTGSSQASTAEHHLTTTASTIKRTRKSNKTRTAKSVSSSKAAPQAPPDQSDASDNEA